MDAINKSVQEISKIVLLWAGPLAGIGTISMAFIQTAKNIVPIRRWFQKIRLKGWLKENANGLYKKDKSTVDSTQAEQDLIKLATSGDKEAFYDLPIEQLCDQIRSIVSVILDYPRLNTDLLYCLASKESVDDIAILLKPPPSATDKKAFSEYASAKTRLVIQVRCSVDAIQTSIGYRWKFWLQLAAIILSAVIGVAAYLLSIGANMSTFWSDITQDTWRALGSALLVGVLAGFLAPVARDLVAAIEKWRS
jgi:hypothetical protein